MVQLGKKIIIALLIYKFGEHNVETDIPTTQPDVDVKVCHEPISVKKITGKRLHGVKLIWTVDEKKLRNSDKAISQALICSWYR